MAYRKQVDNFTNSVNPNTSSYRIEHDTFQTDNKAYYLYMVRTGNIFTNKTTHSRKTADAWALDGEKVLILNTSGRVIGRVVVSGEKTARKFYHDNKSASK